FVLAEECVLSCRLLVQDVVLFAGFGKNQRAIDDLPGPTVGSFLLGGVSGPNFVDVFVEVMGVGLSFLEVGPARRDDPFRDLDTRLEFLGRVPLKSCKESRARFDNADLLRSA